MRNLITFPKGGKASQTINDWQVIRPSAEQEGSLLAIPLGRVILPFGWWLSEQSAQASSQPRSETLAQLFTPAFAKRMERGEIGIWFGVDDDVQQHAELIQASAAQWAIIAIDFPIFRDGRGFSTAAILRQRFQWERELRAIGDVLVDQLSQMARVGFDAFELREDQSITQGLAQFSLYHVHLQNDWRSQRSQLGALP